MNFNKTRYINILAILKAKKPFFKKFLNVMLLSAFCFKQITPSMAVLHPQEEEKKDVVIPVRNKTFSVTQMPPQEDSCLAVKKCDDYLTLPEWATIVGTGFMGFGPTIYIKLALSHLSPEVLAVAELKGPSQDLFYTIGVGALNAVEDLVACEKGHLRTAQNTNDLPAIALHTEQIGKIYRTANIVGMLSSLPLVFAVRLFAPGMVHLGYDPDLYQQVAIFNKFYSLCFPFYNFSFAATNFTIAEGEPRNAFIMSGVTLLMCSIDYAFAFSPSRFKNIFEGLAISELTKSTIYALGFFTILYNMKRYKTYNLFDVSFDKRIATDLVCKSAPIFLQKFFTLLQPMLLMQFILPDNTPFLAANALFSQYFLIGQIFEQGVGKWLNLTLKAPYDERDFNKVISVGKRGFLHSQIIVGILAGTLLIWPDLVASFFVNTHAAENTEMMKIYRAVVRLKVADFILATLGDISFWALRGIGKMRAAVASNIFSSYIITLPLTYYLVLYCDYGLEGAVISSLVGNAVNTFYLQYNWWSEVLQKNIGTFFREHFWGTPEQPSTCRRIFNYCMSYAERQRREGKFY